MEEPLRSFVKKEHRRPAALAGCDSFSFSELNIGRARILQVSFPCRLHLKPARYAETGSVSEEDTSTWRRSSVPLLHHQVFKPAVIEIYAMHKWLILVWTSSNHHNCPVGLWLWTIWARLGLVAARTKTEVRDFTFFKNHFRLHFVVTFFRYGEALVRLRRGLRNGENVGGGEERASALTASPRDSGSTVVEEI